MWLTQSKGTDHVISSNWIYTQPTVHIQEKKNHEKRCRDGMPKITQPRKNDAKVTVNTQSLIHLYIFSQSSKDVGIRLFYIYFHFCIIFPCLCYFLPCHPYNSTISLIPRLWLGRNEAWEWRKQPYFLDQTLPSHNHCSQCKKMSVDQIPPSNNTSSACSQTAVPPG